MYEVYCDESRQDLFYNKDSITDQNKYIVIGGILFDHAERLKLKEKIEIVKEKHNLNRKAEVKWNRVTTSKIDFYKELIDIFFENNILFRCILIDSTKVNLKKYHNDNPELGFYKFYYQLLNNWLEKKQDIQYFVYTDIKTYKNPKVLKDLKRCINNKNKYSIIEKIYAIDSKESVFLQLEDILMGAVAYKANYKNYGKSTSKLELIKHIEQKLGHQIENTNKSENKFNVFGIKL